MLRLPLLILYILSIIVSLLATNQVVWAVSFHLC